MELCPIRRCNAGNGSVVASFHEHAGTVFVDWQVLREFSLAYIEMGIDENIDLAVLINREEPWIPKEVPCQET